MVDYFPKVVKSEKYFDYRDLILYKNKYSILDKPILAILKIFLYDENVYIQEKIEYFCDDYKRLELNELESFKEFESYVNKGIRWDSTLPILFLDLGIGMLIGDGYVTFTKVREDGEVDLVKKIFEKEGLFIR